MLSRKVALALSVLVMLTACRPRAEVETATPRPALRISMRPTEILSAFLNLPQFSVQVVTIGDAPGCIAIDQRTSTCPGVLVPSVGVGRLATIAIGSGAGV